MKQNADLSHVFKSLADPTRLRIFTLLLGGEYCNCELNSATGLPINLVSHHLRILREAGLVNAVRDSTDTRWIHFSVNRERLGEVRVEINRLLEPTVSARRTSNCPPQSSRKDIEP